jgi:hypothetical protein
MARSRLLFEAVFRDWKPAVHLQYVEVPAEADDPTLADRSSKEARLVVEWVPRVLGEIGLSV